MARDLLDEALSEHYDQAERRWVWWHVHPADPAQQQLCMFGAHAGALVLMRVRARGRWRVHEKSEEDLAADVERRLTQLQQQYYMCVAAAARRGARSLPVFALTQ